MKTRRIPPPSGKIDEDYRRIWRIVDGAVRDAFLSHPEYLTEVGHKSAQLSIIKRVTGAIKGHSVLRSGSVVAGKQSGSAYQSQGRDGVPSEKEEA